MISANTSLPNPLDALPVTHPDLEAARSSLHCETPLRLNTQELTENPPDEASQEQLTVTLV
jgi:hypothetical protein